MKRISFILASLAAAVGGISDVRAQEAVIAVEAAKAVAVSDAGRPDATETMRDFMRSEETRVCSELKQFARQVVVKDAAFAAAADERSPKDVMKAADKYALILNKDFNTEFLFYYPNTRFAVRIGDKNYRGRMRLSSETAESSSSCFWERLPSDDVVYSVVVALGADKTGYLKMSKTLPRMISNFPDALSSFGKVRVYTALDKFGLNKMAWFNMRRKEPNPAIGAGWCTAENLAFLSAIGSGKKLDPKTQKKILSLIDLNKDFSYDASGLKGGSLPVIGADGERLGAVVYTLSDKLPPTPDEPENRP